MDSSGNRMSIEVESGTIGGAINGFLVLMETESDTAWSCATAIENWHKANRETSPKKRMTIREAFNSKIAYKDRFSILERNETPSFRSTRLK